MRRSAELSEANISQSVASRSAVRDLLRIVCLAELLANGGKKGMIGNRFDTRKQIVEGPVFATPQKTESA